MKSLLLVVCVFLGLALSSMPQGYYTFLRLVVCSYALFVFFHEIRKDLSWRAIVPALLALLYNPVFPVHFEDKDIWRALNITSIVLFSVLGLPWLLIWKKAKNSLLLLAKILALVLIPTGALAGAWAGINYYKKQVEKREQEKVQACSHKIMELLKKKTYLYLKQISPIGYLKQDSKIHGITPKKRKETPLSFLLSFHTKESIVSHRPKFQLDDLQTTLTKQSSDPRNFIPTNPKKDSFTLKIYHPFSDEQLFQIPLCQEERDIVLSPEEKEKMEKISGVIDLRRDWALDPEARQRTLEKRGQYFVESWEKMSEDDRALTGKYELMQALYDGDRDKLGAIYYSEEYGLPGKDAPSKEIWDHFGGQVALLDQERIQILKTLLTIEQKAPFLAEKLLNGHTIAEITQSLSKEEALLFLETFSEGTKEEKELLSTLQSLRSQ